MQSLALFLLAFGAMVSVDTLDPSPDDPIHERDALMLRVTQSDLNTVLGDLSAAHGWERYSGERTKNSRGLHELRYDVTLSPPRLELDGDAGEMNVDFGILEADLNVGRIERKVGAMKLRCENIGIRVSPENPVDVHVALGLQLEEGALRMSPGEVNVDGGKREFRLIRPTRCRATLLPGPVAWWLGKPYLRKKLSRLDDVLLSRLEKLAAEIDQERGVLRSRWDLSSRTVDLSVSRFDLGGGALSVSLDVSESPAGATHPTVVAAPTIPALGTHLALSESVLNAVLAANMSAGDGPAKPAGGGLRKLARSESIYTLIPGLRKIADRDRLRFRMRMDAAPEFHLTPHDDPADPTRRARIGISVGSFALEISDSFDALALGELRIVSGRIDVAPYVNTIGGVSLQVLRNEWRVEGVGVEHNEEMIAAMLQELMFGELFETQYEPLIRDGVVLAKTGFLPTGFRVVDGYLVVDLVAGDAVSTSAATVSTSGVDIPSSHANR